MGFKLSSLVNLPIDEEVDLYIFSIGDGLWEGGLREVVERNFDRIARSIGPNSIIVGALEDEFHGEVVEKYLGVKASELKNEMPALLITDAHPDKLTESSMRVLVPLRDAREHYGVIDRFLADLASFARGESDDLLAVLEDSDPGIDAVNEIVSVRIPVVPGAIAVNLNAAVKHLRAWWNRLEDCENN